MIIQGYVFPLKQSILQSAYLLRLMLRREILLLLEKLSIHLSCYLMIGRLVFWLIIWRRFWQKRLKPCCHAVLPIRAQEIFMIYILFMFCVGLKHMNPCGAAIGADVMDAWTKAYEADKVSIFGGIVAVNREITREVAEAMKPIFLEIIMAPSFSDEALEVLCTKKNLRLLVVDMSKDDSVTKQYVSVNGGLLVQDLDKTTAEVKAEMCVTAAKPTAEQLSDLNFGWRIVKHVKSNAIAVVKDGHTVGVGAGQMNRVGSAEIALKQAHAAGFTEGLVLASDGFFPFDDSVTLAAQYGVTAIVQPGGSVRDEDSIKKADENGITMLFTGMRHFKH